MILLANGKLITRDANGTGYYPDGGVVTDGGKIVAVGTTAELKASYPAAEFVDARGGVIMKAIKPLPRRKLYEKVPLMDCFTAPCKGGCPIGQDIPEYIELVGKGAYASALRVITEKNPLPFITGTICAHRCMTKCTRNFYDEPVQIRASKLVAAERGYDQLMDKLNRPAPADTDVKAAIIGGGPTGISAGYFLGRAGIPCTIFEKADSLGGIVRQVIPAFRISDAAIDKDVALMMKMGVEVKCGAPAPSVAELKKMGYTHIFFACGAWRWRWP